MKILFLDFDGVLNSASDRYSQALSSEKAEHLNAIVRRTSARVVVSSSWRYGTPVPRLRRTLRSIGFAGSVIGKTPEGQRKNGLYVAAIRGDEIQEWLNGYVKRHLVESFVILDDESDMGHLTHRLVQTDSNVGLTANDAERVVELLSPIRRDAPGKE